MADATKRGLCVWDAQDPLETLRFVRSDGKHGRRIDLVNQTIYLFPSERHRLLRALRYMTEDFDWEGLDRGRISLSPGMDPVCGMDGHPIALRVFHSAILPITSFEYSSDMIEALFCIERDVRDLLYQARLHDSLTADFRAEEVDQ